jgi:hypothetical protein
MVDGYVGGIYKLLKIDIAYGIYGSEGFSPWKALLELLIVQLVVVVSERRGCQRNTSSSINKLSLIWP